ncbi:hypothetical protein DFJ74DRAFT_508793 [Hyaloraphidium curvatum]|nr:hypothetical protein DFJ74DRAFT_508793 [Hyaloraphidium curvatum]
MISGDVQVGALAADEEHHLFARHRCPTCPLGAKFASRGTPCCPPRPTSVVATTRTVKAITTSTVLYCEPGYGFEDCQRCAVGWASSGGINARCAPCPNGQATPDQTGCVATSCIPARSRCDPDKICGTQPNGCGGNVFCGACTTGQACTGNGTQCVAKVSTCKPRTTCDAGQVCGTQGDGCGGFVTCGTCSAGRGCNVAHSACDNFTLPGCVPEDVSATCIKAGRVCGTTPNNCGTQVNCGTCSGTKDTCAIDGSACVVGGSAAGAFCRPLTTCPSGVNCGTYPNGCGGFLVCGICPGSQVCSSSGDRCGAPPPACKPKTSCSGGRICGSEPDGCGGVVRCGACTSGQVCSTDQRFCFTPQAACAPKTFDLACGAKQCGSAHDGCGGTVPCGSCANGWHCDTATSQCAPGVAPSCTPKTSCAVGRVCGFEDDGCGSIVSCSSQPDGTCAGGIPGSAVSAYTCSPSGYSCTPVTPWCTPIQHCNNTGLTQTVSNGPFVIIRSQCGFADDGCGGTLRCDTCPNGHTCSQGFCLQGVLTATKTVMTTRSTITRTTQPTTTTRTCGTPTAIPLFTERPGQVFQVTSPDCKGPGTMDEAIQKANGNPGIDTVVLMVDIDKMHIDPYDNTSCWLTPSEALRAWTITESVVIEGNGHSIIGHYSWVGSDGSLNNVNVPKCPSSQRGVIITSETVGMFNIGAPGKDNNWDLHVTLRNVKIDGVRSIADVRERSIFDMLNVDATNVIDYIRSCQSVPIQVRYGSILRIRNSNFSDFHNWAESIGGMGAGVIAADRGCYLEAVDSVFTRTYDAGFIVWTPMEGSYVNIVNTYITGAQGIQVFPSRNEKTIVNIVNSVIFLGDSDFGEIETEDTCVFMGSKTVVNVKASSVVVASIVCHGTCDWGSDFSSLQGAKVNVVESAFNAFDPDGLNKSSSTRRNLPLLGGDGSFTADRFTWVLPTRLQGPSALKTRMQQPQLLTADPGLAYIDPRDNVILDMWAKGQPTNLFPLEKDGTGKPGLLIGRITSAGPTGVNSLRSPIYPYAVLTTDALGNPRTDKLNRRDIGGLQKGM